MKSDVNLLINIQSIQGVILESYPIQQKSISVSLKIHKFKSIKSNVFQLAK